MQITENQTPEHKLWFAVLGSWILDIRGSNSIYSLKRIPITARNRRTREICELVGIEFDAFIEGLEKEAERQVDRTLEIEEKINKKRIEKRRNLLEEIRLKSKTESDSIH